MAVKGKLGRTLRARPNVVTRAVLWSIPHDSCKEDINLKIGRYVRSSNLSDPDTPEVGAPKSELTLDHEELSTLMEFLAEHFEPFRQGVKAFIPLEKPYQKDTAEQIRRLFSLPDKQNLVRFILSNEVIPEDLAIGLQHAKRARAVREFEQMLAADLTEPDWQHWFQQNSWVLGSEFVRVLDERAIDTQHISDFLMEAYDGFLDIVEIKRPEGGLTFWATALDHGNYVPSVSLTKAIAQASRYVYEVEREANSIKFLERVSGVQTVKPRCILIFGRSNDWNPKQVESYRILNAGFHNLSILTYDHVLARAKRIVGDRPAVEPVSRRLAPAAQ